MINLKTLQIIEELNKTNPLTYKSIVLSNMISIHGKIIRNILSKVYEDNTQAIENVIKLRKQINKISANIENINECGIWQ